MRKRVSRSRSRIMETASTTSSKPSARSKRTFASTATSCGLFSLPAIVEFHELFSEFFALRVRPLVALGPRPRGEHRAGGRLLDSRFLAFHAGTLPASEKVSNPEKLRQIDAGNTDGGHGRHPNLPSAESFPSPYLLVDRAGGARHYSGMAQKSTDEARRPPGTGPFVNRRSP